MAREHYFLSAFKKLFDLRSDMDEPSDIEASISHGIKIHGTNLWILMFAIFVASIGLNVNSTAAIIGAMLISPLMGPIMGIGYGAGIDNFGLIRQSFRSLTVFVLLSLLTSTIYFFLTPLQQAQSELLARTSPTLWDLLIALFGGMAGIIAVTRKDKSNVLPGVAIATALMPPLCTAGFGIATGQPRFFFGAFYLFTINAVYIALSALLFTRLLRLPRQSFPSVSIQKRARIVITTAIIATIIPSAYLAVQLVKKEVFITQANSCLTAIAKTEKNLFLLQKDINSDTNVITLTVAGKGLDKATIERINAQFDQFSLKGAKLIVNSFQEDNGLNLNQLKTEMRQDLYRNSLQLLESKNAKIQELEDVIRNQKVDQSKHEERLSDYEQVREELKAQYPELTNVQIAHGQNAPQSGTTTDLSAPSDDTLIVYLELRKPLSRANKTRIRKWMMSHYKLKNVYVFSKNS